MDNASILLCAASALGIAWQMLHIFQLEGYVLKPTFKWIFANPSRLLLRPAFIVSVIASVIILFSGIGILNAALGAGAAVFAWLTTMPLVSGENVKKKIAYTKRLQRLIGVLIAVWLVITLLAFVTKFMLVLLCVISPLLTLIAGWIMDPVEKGINRRFFEDAKRKLAARDIIKIGITGSYGKTSTKFILTQLLKEKYNVLTTPSSFNTPMGLTRVIREQLKDEHEVFVAEMGARHVGDIKELCELVNPKYGLITKVGKQHLETFFTLENIISTKYELIDALPKDGMAFFADDKDIVKGMYDRTGIAKRLSGFDESCDVWASDINVSALGSTFTICKGNDSIEVSTKLLGRHNISNIMLCVSCALELGLTLEDVKNGLLKLEPVEHRLQLIPGANGLTVIDDAFNSNPEGAKAALDVIKNFNGRRVIITPGMVELGGEENALNEQFGVQMASSVDTAILIGAKRTEPIYNGLIKGGFNKDNIIVAETLNEATALIGKYAGRGDVVLFENDLPDNY